MGPAATCSPGGESTNPIHEPWELITTHKTRRFPLRTQITIGCTSPYGFFYYLPMILTLIPNQTCFQNFAFMGLLTTHHYQRSQDTTTKHSIQQTASATASPRVASVHFVTLLGSSMSGMNKRGKTARSATETKNRPSNALIPTGVWGGAQNRIVNVRQSCHEMIRAGASVRLPQE